MRKFRHVCYSLIIQSTYLDNLICYLKDNLAVTALGMAQSSKHGSVGPIHPEIQGPQVPVGPAGRSFRQLQGRQVPGYRPQKTLRTRRVLLQTVPGRCHPLIRTRLQVTVCLASIMT